MINTVVSVDRPLTVQELTECNKEQLHLIGCVQKTACLLSVDDNFIQFQESTDSASLVATLASSVKAISGFDRVMVYQFAEGLTREHIPYVSAIRFADRIDALASTIPTMILTQPVTQETLADALMIHKSE